MAGSPPLYGGYEYIPTMQNKRKNDTLLQKREEAISLLPRLFVRNGFSAVMTDMPWADNYSIKSNFYFMDKYPEKINSVRLFGKYSNKYIESSKFEFSKIRVDNNKRNFIYYSLLRISPYLIRKMIYNDGKWWRAEKKNEIAEDMNTAINDYSSLFYLPEMSDNEATKNSFSYICNTLTHDPVFLQAPDYIPTEKVTNKGSGTYSEDSTYHVNCAALYLLGRWFDWLKQNDIYNNTRIIISADHGSYWSNNIPGYNNSPSSAFFPLLLVKDFDEEGKLKIDNSFMTNADVPTIAVKGIIKNPINPATGVDITKIQLKNPAYVEFTDWVKTKDHDGNTLTIGDNDWYSIKDDILKAENWKHVTPEEAMNSVK